MARPDLVWVVRDGDDNDELRWSLRTAVNLAHGRVWLVGGQPSWTRNVQRIGLRQPSDKWAAVLGNLNAVADHPDISETFVLMHDDYFVLEPASLADWHRGPWEQVLAGYKHRRDRYAQMLRKAARRWPDGFCWDAVHRPMLMEKGRLRDVLDDGCTGLYRSHYGNLHDLQGTQVPDCKVKNNRPPKPTTFLSTSDASFRRGEAGRMIRRMWPHKGPYER